MSFAHKYFQNQFWTYIQQTYFPSNSIARGGCEALGFAWCLTTVCNWSLPLPFGAILVTVCSSKTEEFPLFYSSALERFRRGWGAAYTWWWDPMQKIVLCSPSFYVSATQHFYWKWRKPMVKVGLKQQNPFLSRHRNTMNSNHWPAPVFLFCPLYVLLLGLQPVPSNSNWISKNVSASYLQLSEPVHWFFFQSEFLPFKRKDELCSLQLCWVAAVFYPYCPQNLDCFFILPPDYASLTSRDFTALDYKSCSIAQSTRLYRPSFVCISP